MSIILSLFFHVVDPGYFEGVKKVLHFGTVQKELVDPYCTVSFAGKKGKTPVIWNEQDPEWNHQLNLGIRVSIGMYTVSRTPQKSDHQISLSTL